MKCILTSGLLNLSCETDNTEILSPCETELIDRKQPCLRSIFVDSVIGRLGCLRLHPMEACRGYAFLHNTLLPVLHPPLLPLQTVTVINL